MKFPVYIGIRFCKSPCSNKMKKYRTITGSTSFKGDVRKKKLYPEVCEALPIFIPMDARPLGHLG